MRSPARGCAITEARGATQGADPRSPAPLGPAAGWSLRERLGRVALAAAGRINGAHPILLEYPPPDVSRARWGWGSPSNRPLRELLAAGAGAYLMPIQLIEEHAADLRAIPVESPPLGGPHWGQVWFQGLDAAALYSFIRARRPARYHEIGSGHSTLFAARAIRDGSLDTKILSVDPKPRADVDRVCDEVVRRPLEAADLDRVTAVAAGDVVLIDSSHHAFAGSDVVAFFLEALPDLPPGVLVGVHDVFLPDDYPWWLATRRYTEQYLLAAWLLGAGDRAQVVLPAHFAGTEPSLRAQLDAAWRQARLPSLAYGSSFWIET